MLLVCDAEPDDSYRYHVEALLSYLPDARVLDCSAADDSRDLPAADDLPPLDDVDAAVVTGSSAGVYEADERPWIPAAARLVRRLVAERVPTLGVCFGHQIVNAALGGAVEGHGTTARLVAVEFDDDPLFDGIAPTVPAVHGDHVVEPGDDLRVIGSAEHCEVFATRHREAPLWTVQYHPEFTADLRPRLREDFGWSRTDRSFDDVTADRTYDNFLALAGIDPSSG